MSLSDEWVAFKASLFPGQPSSQRRVTRPSLTAPRPHFLVGFNPVHQVVAVTLVEQTRRVSHDRANSLATCLRLADLAELNRDLSLICPGVETHFAPVQCLIEQLNQQNSTLFFVKYLFGLAGGVEGRSVEEGVSQYLCEVTRLCGLETLKLLLFKKHLLDDCYEQSDTLQLEGLERGVESARAELASVVGLRREAASLLQVVGLYGLEDSAAARLRQALAELSAFQLRPLLLMRESALEGVASLTPRLHSADFGQRVRHQASQSLAALQSDLHSCSGAIQQIYLDYFRQTEQLLGAQVSRALADQSRFGQNALEASGASARLEALRTLHCRERIEYLLCRKSLLQRHLACLAESGEGDSPDTRLQLIEVRMEIAGERARLARARLAAVEREASDTSHFHDAVQHWGEGQDTHCLSLKRHISALARRTARLRAIKFRLEREIHKQSDSLTDQPSEAPDTPHPVEAPVRAEGASESDSTSPPTPSDPNPPSLPPPPPPPSVLAPKKPPTARPEVSATPRPVALLDLQEVLSARARLRPAVRSGGGGVVSDPLHCLLHSALSQMRHARHHSDSDDEDEDGQDNPFDE